MNNQLSKNKSLLMLAGILFIIWGIFGLMDAKNYTYSGYQSAGDYSIIKVDPGSPAEAAGMLVGDVIKSSGGIAITDSKELSKRERTKIGEVRTFVVNRNGADVTLQLTYAAMQGKDNLLNIVSFFLGLLFVVLAYYVYHTLNTELSFALALFLLTFGCNFFGGAYIEPGMLSNIVNSINSAILMFSFAFLAVFILQYPPKSKFLDSDINRKMLYVPAILLIIMFTVLNFAKPEGSSSLNSIVRIILGVVIILYFVLALLTLIQKYRNADAQVRSASGLNHMILGAMIGLLPILIYFSINTIMPKIILPGNDYLFITFGAIPIFFTLALLQQSKSNG
jgi:hypothetical protein